MRAKILLVSLSLLVVLFVSAQEGGIDYTIIYNCEEAGYEQCAYVVGPIYSFQPETANRWVTLPPEGAILRQMVGCQDETAVTLARYDHDQKKWIPYADVEVTPDDGAAVKVSALVDQIGDIAIIQKNTFTGFNEGNLCEPLHCFSNGAFITNPFKLYTTKQGQTLPSAVIGNEITLSFCGMLPGCVVNKDNICNSGTEGQPGENHCQKGIALDCDQTCTNEPEPDNCCSPGQDGKCDPDCYLEKNSEGRITSATDPDCFEFADTLQGKYASFGYTFNAPTSKDWETYTFPLNTKAIVYGPIQFDVAEGDDHHKHIWFARFQYQDFNGNWHYMIPTGQLPNGDTMDDYTDRGYEDGFGDTELGVFWEYPSRFLQARADWNKGQFWFFNTPVQGIRFESKQADDSDGVETFAIRFNGVPVDNFDSDGDGATEGFDCHDTDPEIYPGAKEICDGIDNNCNAYTTDKSLDAQFKTNVYFDSKDSTTHSDEDYTATSTYFMPCDGYIKFNKIITRSVMEVKRIDAFTKGIDPFDGTESVLINEQFDLESYFGFDRVRLFDNSDEKVADYMGYTKNNPFSSLPTTFRNRHKTIFFSNNFGTSDDDQGVIDGTCLIGFEDSCTCKHREDPYDLAWYTDVINNIPELFTSGWFGGCPYQEDLNYIEGGVDRDHPVELEYDALLFKRDAKSWSAEDRTTRFRTDDKYADYTITDFGGHEKVEFLKGDVLKMWVSEQDGGGRFDFDVYCYQTKLNKSNIDEGACETKKAKVYVCKTDVFSQSRKQCLGGEWCNVDVDETSISIAENALQANIVAECTINPTKDMLGIQNFYTYICLSDPEEPCYRFYNNGQFQVCSTKELCYNNIDDDCDGTVDRADLECQGACYEGECDIVEKKWCANSAFITEDYCKSCGHVDASCSKSCALEEQSCGGGCREGACDTAADLVCTNGAWTQSNYANKCKPKDSELSSSCEEEACDTQYNKTCLSERWISDRTVCVRSCGPKDASCYFERKELAKEPYCEPGTCDIYENKYCTVQHEWTQASYCNYCGAIDSDCGTKSCSETITLGDGTLRGNCDYVNQKYCDNGQWLTAGYCALENCGLDSLSQTICGCSPTAAKEEKELCLNNIDDDCDGYKDCADSDCPKDLPGCSCESGEEKNCYADPLKHFGLCEENPGKLTCTNGAWGTCTNPFAPEIEVCNSFDDNCDGTEDEGCGGCKTGQTRNCGADRGLCGAGVQECDETGHWSLCFGTGYTKPEIEKCGDGKDNDCNGETDEGCGCVEGAEQQCGTDVGECDFGTQKCTGGTWGACLGGKVQVPEVGSQCLDSKDNDCDGKTDSQDENCGVTPEEDLAPLCYDTIQNGDEEEVDCGGSTCQPCNEVSCNDRQQNGDEEGKDCGGSRGCPACKGKATTKLKTEGKETEDVAEETEELPEEVPEEKFPWMYIIAAIIVLTGVLFLLYNKFGKKPEQKPQRRTGIIAAGPTLAKPTVKQQQKPMKERITKSRDESTLERSFEEAKGLFKK